LPTDDFHVEFVEARLSVRKYANVRDAAIAQETETTEDPCSLIRARGLTTSDPCLTRV